MHHQNFELMLIIGGFFTGILQKIFKDYVADKVSACLKWLFVHSEREAIYYIHYRDKRMKHRGHNSKDPILCADDKCRQV